MRGSANSYSLGQQYLQQYLNRISWRPLSLDEQQYFQKIKVFLAEQQRKFYAKVLNPFNLCPLFVTVWFPVLPSLTIGISFSSIQDIGIYIRQAMDPTLANIFSLFKILEFRTPFPLVLLTMFSAVGLFFNGKINKLIQQATSELITEQDKRLQGFEEKLDCLLVDKSLDLNVNLDNELEKKIAEIIAQEKSKSITQALNPFNLTPVSMSVFFPIYQKHTAVGIVFHDLDYLGIGLLQALEPNDKIYSIIRIIHTQTPFALDLLALFLGVGLFLSGGVNKVEQGAREEVISNVKEGINEIKEK